MRVNHLRRAFDYWVAMSALVVLAFVTAPAPAHDPQLPPPQTLGPADDEVFPPGSTAPASPQFGDAIASDDRTVLVGLPGYSTQTGRVAVFEKDRAGQWKRVDSIDSPKPRQDDQFGGSLAVDDDLALVRAAGSGLYVFHRERGKWVFLKHYPTLRDLTAITNNQVFLGTSIYRIDQRGKLRLLQTLTSGEGDTDDAFGASIAVSEDTAVVGAPGDDDGRGAAYVFIRHGERWVKRQKLIAIDGPQGDQFGTSVSIADRLIAVGASGGTSEEDFGCDSGLGGDGSVYVFARRQGQWTEQQRIENQRCAVDFGIGIAINLHMLAVRDTSIQPASFAKAYFYLPMSGQFNFVEATQHGGDVAVTTLSSSPAAVFVASDFARGPFRIGVVDVYDFGRHRSRNHGEE